MKKILIALLLLLLLAIASVYIFIPATIRVSRSLTINAPKDALYRKLITTTAWNDWWPEKQNQTDTGISYSLKGIRYYPGDPKIISLPVLLKDSNISVDAEITFILKSIDTTILHFQVDLSSTSNPLKKMAVYFKARKLANQFSTILTAIENQYSSTKNLYDYDIQKKRVVDSTLIFTSAEMKIIPDINSIYSLIDKLRNYISKNAAMETGSPMLNIFKKDSSTYLIKVAIPVDKKLPSSGDISYRWMLGGGNILITEVKGGQTEINKAYKQVSNYISDYHRIAPAIPFESLVTDRRKEPDSSKWITRIYYPVM